MNFFSAFSKIASGAPPETIVVLDTFQDISGTLLQAHVPDISPGGALWQKLGNNLKIQSNTLVGDTGIDPLYIINAGISEGTVTMNVNIDLSDNQVDFYAAASSVAAGGRLILIAYPSANQIQFFQGGVINPPGTIPYTFSAGPQVWKLVILGTTATFYIDGVQIGTPATITPSTDAYWGVELYHPTGGGPPLSTISQFKIVLP